MTNRFLLTVAILLLYALHQDYWLWGTARPLVFGFLPIGLAWHAGYCLAVALLMWWLTRVAWPTHLDPSTSLRTGRSTSLGAGPSTSLGTGPSTSLGTGAQRK